MTNSYTLTALGTTLGNIDQIKANHSAFRAWAKDKDWKWVEKIEEGEEPYWDLELKTNDLAVIATNILKLFELKIEAEAKDTDGEKVAAVWSDPSADEEWNYFYTENNNE